MGKLLHGQDLLGAILGSRRPTVVVRGPVRSGKTEAVCRLYERGLTDPTAPGCWVVVPNRLTEQWLRRRLLDRTDSGVLAAPKVMTFTSLAGLILQAAGVECRRISPLRRRAVLEGIIAELADAGRLQTLGAVADTPGLVRTVDVSIAELKRAAVEPEALRAACDGGGKHADLCAIYEAYQQHLQAEGLFDEEGRMWQARDELAGLGAFPATAGGVKVLAVDGFTDFTPTQLAILHRLSAHVERLVITLPHAVEPERKKLWRWTSRQLARIDAVFGDECEHLEVAADEDADAPTGTLLSGVFAPAGAQAAWPTSLAAVAAAGIDSECRAIGRWAKGLMTSGVPVEEIAVVARRVEPYETALHRVFTEAALPAPAPRAPLAGTGLGRMLLTVVRLADGFASSDLLAVLGGSYFDPAALGGFSPTAPQTAQAVIREANVLEGRTRYAGAFERIAHRVEQAGETGADEFVSPLTEQLIGLGAEAVAEAGAMVEHLLDQLAPLAEGGAAAELAAACLTLLQGWIRPTLRGDDAFVAAELRTFAALTAALEEMASLADVPAGGRKLTCRAFHARLAATLTDVAAAPERETGTILLASALDVRAVRARHVWLAGLNEGAFPASASEQALIGEADRRRWAEKANWPLDGREDLTAREMLLFYLTAARADATLTISWLYSDEGGRAMAASEFVDALLHSTHAAAANTRVLPPAELAPPLGRILSRRELWNTAMAAAADRSSASPGAAALDAARRGGGLGCLAGPLWAARRRWAAEPCDRWDGVLDDEALLEVLARRVGDEEVMSASRINTYIACPWRYFAERILKAAELPTPDEVLLPRHRGSLVHAVLRRMLATMVERGGATVEALVDEEAMAVLDAAIEAEAAAADGAVACRGLWENELRQLRRDIVAYLTRQAAAPLPGQRVRMLEAPFGMGDGGEAEPLVLDGPAGKVRLRGMIDRVDVVATDDGPKAYVIDYKTGALPDPKTDVQLPIYSYAAERILGLPCAGGAFHGVGRKHKSDKALAEISISRGKVKVHDDYPDRLAEAADRLHAAVAGVAAGRFSLMTDHACQATRCPYRRICGYSEVRRLFKVPADDEQEARDDG